jgi:hypothetical protein
MLQVWAVRRGAGFPVSDTVCPTAYRGRIDTGSCIHPFTSLPLPPSVRSLPLPRGDRLSCMFPISGGVRNVPEQRSGAERSER